MDLAIDCVPVMTINKHESDETPASDKDESSNGKEITEKVIKIEIHAVIMMHRIGVGREGGRTNRLSNYARCFVYNTWSFD